MKTKILLLGIILSISFSGCSHYKYITERYLKNTIETHKTGEYSNLKTIPVFSGMTVNKNAYLELTGYSLNETKGLVIGSERVYLIRSRSKDDKLVAAETTFIELTADQCKLIIDNYNTLENQITGDKRKGREEIYRDFTISNDLFISFHKGKGELRPIYLHLWIKGMNHKVDAKRFIKSLEKFTNNF
ncbi:MAG: hypothetical protein NTU44_17565 [Bacteroidetes bacterium]|nr:hypothetical protein [Bacteroidota bacterium]